MSDAIPENVKAALNRLIRIGQNDTGQSRRVANFLLAWWNAGACGGADMVTVFAFLPARRQQPDTLGYRRQFGAILDAWRPAGSGEKEETL